MIHSLNHLRMSRLQEHSGFQEHSPHKSPQGRSPHQLRTHNQARSTGEYLRHIPRVHVLLQGNR